MPSVPKPAWQKKDTGLTIRMIFSFAILTNALLKISGTMKRIPTKDLRQVEGLNAFFIVPALSGSTIGNLFSTHPPVEKRVQKLMEMEASMS